jgi:hypothetical protein
LGKALKSFSGFVWLLVLWIHHPGSIMALSMIEAISFFALGTKLQKQQVTCNPAFL